MQVTLFHFHKSAITLSKSGHRDSVLYYEPSILALCNSKLWTSYSQGLSEQPLVKQWVINNNLQPKTHCGWKHRKDTETCRQKLCWEIVVHLTTDVQPPCHCSVTWLCSAICSSIEVLALKTHADAWPLRTSSRQSLKDMQFHGNTNSLPGANGML